ncbi:hypothetical protein ACIP5U_37310 [Streptomyces sp. NPDC088788]|uniref:hypothetical protein n=1 Tax=Streptomyces sp. NPDC088788 TaxID=3365898 RepID=UPI0037FEF017
MDVAVRQPEVAVQARVVDNPRVAVSLPPRLVRGGLEAADLADLGARIEGGAQALAGRLLAGAQDVGGVEVAGEGAVEAATQGGEADR